MKLPSKHDGTAARHAGTPGDIAHRRIPDFPWEETLWSGGAHSSDVTYPKGLEMYRGAPRIVAPGGRVGSDVLGVAVTPEGVSGRFKGGGVGEPRVSGGTRPLPLDRPTTSQYT